MAMPREKIGQEKKSFGVTLRRFRTEKLHISTVNEMAVKMGVRKDIYANWELGRSSPEPFQVIALLQLSPPEWLREFGLDIAKLGDQYPSPQVPQAESDTIDHLPAADVPPPIRRRRAIKKMLDGRTFPTHRKPDSRP
jgi:transcriptional regulator with XRE-family HTH domain